MPGWWSVFVPRQRDIADFDYPLSPENPVGESKLYNYEDVAHIQVLLKDLASYNDDGTLAALIRYEPMKDMNYVLFQLENVVRRDLRGWRAYDIDARGNLRTVCLETTMAEWVHFGKFKDSKYLLFEDSKF